MVSVEFIPGPQTAGPPLGDAPSGVVVMASSAGGLPALLIVLSALPAEFPAAVVIVQHLDPRFVSRMPELLARRTPLKVRQAAHGAPLRAGCVDVAPPDRHVLVNGDGTLSLDEGERVQWVRPSADVLFESVARCYGPRAVAVVLSGTGRDGARGCTAVHQRGGRVVVQDAESSAFRGMPEAAAGTGDADVVLPLPLIARELVRWAQQLRHV